MTDPAPELNQPLKPITIKETVENVYYLREGNDTLAKITPFYWDKVDNIRRLKPLLAHIEDRVNNYHLAETNKRLEQQITNYNTELIKAAKEAQDARIAFNKLYEQWDNDQCDARDAGVNYGNIRDALKEWQNEDVTFDRLVEIVRTSAKVMCEKLEKEKLDALQKLSTRNKEALELAETNKKLFEAVNVAKHYIENNTRPDVTGERSAVYNIIDQALAAAKGITP